MHDRTPATCKSSLQVQDQTTDGDPVRAAAEALLREWDAAHAPGRMLEDLAPRVGDLRRALGRLQ